MTWFCLKHNWTPQILCDYPVILRHLRNKFELQVKIVKTKVKHLGHPRAYGGSSSKFSRFPLFGQCHPWRWSSPANKRPLSRCVSPRWPARSSNFLSTVTSCVNLHDGKSWNIMETYERYWKLLTVLAVDFGGAPGRSLSSHPMSRRAWHARPPWRIWSSPAQRAMTDQSQGNIQLIQLPMNQ